MRGNTIHGETRIPMTPVARRYDVLLRALAIYIYSSVIATETGKTSLLESYVQERVSLDVIRTVGTVDFTILEKSMVAVI